MLTNAPFTVKESIRVGDGKYYYRGVIYHGGKEIHFCDESIVLAGSRASRWLTKRVAETGGAALARSSELLAIAFAFHEPEEVTGRSSCGWNGVQFDLPGGEIGPSGSSSHSLLIPGPRYPASSLCVDSEPDPVWITRASQTEAAPFWTAAACVLAPILSPTASIPAPNTVCRRLRGFDLFSDVARATGCLTSSVGSARARSVEHSWPVLVKTAAHVARELFVGRHPHNLLLCANSPVDALYACLTGHWHLLRMGRSDPLLTDGWSKAVPSFLKYVCGRLPLSGGTGPIAVLDLLAGWFRGRRGNPTPILVAGFITETSAELVAYVFADLLSLCGYRCAGHLTVSKESFNEFLDSKNLPPVSDDSQKALASTGVKCLDHCWEISPDWGNRFTEPRRGAVSCV